MYNNRIRRTNTNLDLQSMISRADIAYDERARYVEFVCNVWNEGRFGPDLADPVTVDWSDRPNLEPASFLDLDDTGQSGLDGQYASAPWSRGSILGRAADQAAEATFRRANQMGLLADISNGTNITAHSISNQGRGSP